MDTSTAITQLNRQLQKNSPTILTGLGVAGLITTVIMAVYATPKAMQLIVEEEEYNEKYGITNKDGTLTLTPTEIVKAAYKPYIPAAIMGAATIACIVGSNSVNMRRNAALAAIFSLTETAAREYREKVKKVIGEKKEQAVADEIAQDTINKHPLKDSSVVITGNGNILCYDKLSGRYFSSDINKIKNVEIEYNQRLIREMWLPLNDLYQELGLEEIALGNDMGWVVERLLQFKFSSRLTPDGQPCLVVDYAVGPRDI